jgi:hypothetical protein
MNTSQSRSLEPTTKRRALRLAGIPVGIVVTLTIALALVGQGAAATTRTAVAPANSSPPTIAGTAQQGQTLTADKGAWTGTEPITYSYEWQRCDSGGGHCRAIKGVTGTTYVLVKRDVNNTLRFVVTAKNAEATMTATSVATALTTAAANTAQPANTALPTVSGTVQEGQTLTADNGTWTGTEPITYSYSWQRCDSSGGRCAHIGGSNHTTYAVQKSDVDSTLRVAVTGRNASGTNSATSAPTVMVKTSAVAPAVRLSISTSKVVYNTPVTLSGTISSKLAGQSVRIQQQRFGFADTNFSPLATVTTNSDGGWTLSTKATVKTTYQAQWNGATSSLVSVGVHPLVTFHAIVGNRFSTKVMAGRSFATRIVQLQRRSSVGQWVTIKRMHLNASSTAIFRATLPKGTSALRIAFSVNQAGPGYLGGMSRTIVYHRS